jgi:DNA-binding MarR family transcriptional regulator
MSRGHPDRSADRRGKLLAALYEAGRQHSNAEVMFHSALSARMELSMTEEKTLDLLERSGPLTAGDLVRHTGLAPASVTGLIDRLARKGFVRRVPHSTDRRRVVVEINREHVGSFGALFDGFVAGLNELYDTYTDAELEVILDFLRQAARIQHEATAELTGGAESR